MFASVTDILPHKTPLHFESYSSFLFSLGFISTISISVRLSQMHLVHIPKMGLQDPGHRLIDPFRTQIRTIRLGVDRQDKNN